MDGFFGIGLLELFLIAILALIVLGPERLPGAMRQIANYIREIRRMGSELTSQFSEELQVLDELNPKRLIDEITDPNYNEKKAGAKPAPKPAAKPPTKPSTPAKPLASPPASPPAVVPAAAAAGTAAAATTGPEAGDAPAAAQNGGENSIMPPQPPLPEPAPANGAGDPPAPEPLSQAETPRAAEQADEQQ
jgi:sec-independent protein translocase protein TatB